MTDIKFKIGGKYTLIHCTGVTTRKEIVVYGISEGRYTFKYPRKKKEYYIPAGPDLREYLVFEGHALPLKLDSDTSKFVMTADINILTDDPEALKTFLKEKCLNPSLYNLGKVLYWPANGEGKKGIQLFKSAELSDQSAA